MLFKLKLLRCPQTIRNEGALVVDHQTFETTSDSKILGRISLASLHFIQLKFFASSQNPSRLGLCQARMADVVHKYLGSACIRSDSAVLVRHSRDKFKLAGDRAAGPREFVARASHNSRSRHWPECLHQTHLWHNSAHRNRDEFNTKLSGKV